MRCNSSISFKGAWTSDFGQIAIGVRQLLEKITRLVPCLALGNTRWNGHRRPADQRCKPKTFVGRKPVRQLISKLGQKHRPLPNQQFLIMLCLSALADVLATHHSPLATSSL